MGRIECSSSVSLFYGIYVHDASLNRAVQTFSAVVEQLVTLDIFMARSSSSTFGDGKVSKEAALRLPRELWQEIKLMLVHSHLVDLEERDRLEKEKKENLKLKKEGEGDENSYDSDGESGSDSEGETYESSWDRKRRIKIRKELLARYSLYAPSNDPNEFTALSLHPPLKSSHHDIGGSTEFHGIPLVLPTFDPTNARDLVKAFVADYRIQVNEDPLIESYRSEHDEGRGRKTLSAEKKAKEEVKLRERQAIFPRIEPRWVLVHNTTEYSF